MNRILLLSLATLLSFGARSQSCDTLDTQWVTPTPTSQAYGFGGGYITGVQDPVNSVFPDDLKGIYEQYVNPDPGVAEVGAVRVGLGYLNDPDDDLTFRVVVMDDDGAGAPGTVVGVTGFMSPTTLGVPGFGLFDEFWINMPTNPIPTTGTFHVGVEIVPDDATDTLVVESSCLGPTSCAVAEGEADASNHIFTSGFGYENLLTIYGADFDINIVPKMGSDDPSFAYGSPIYFGTDPNPTPTITGSTGGTFTSSPFGLALDPATGEINLAACAVGIYTVTYTTADCSLTMDQTVNIASIPGGLPINDDCANAISISCGQTISATTVGSTNNDAPGFCGTTLDDEGIWYTFTGDGRTVTLSLCNAATYDSKIGVFSGSCGALTCVDGNDDFGGCGLTSEVEIDTDCGETYYVYVSGFNGATGAFDITMTCAGPLVITQDINVNLDATGNYSFDSPYTPQVDVEVTTTDGSNSAVLQWQSFTAATDGILQAITFDVGVIAPGPYSVAIYDGEGIGGTNLYLQFVGGAASSNTTVTHILTGRTEVIGGNQYTIEVSSAASFDWLSDSSDPYNGGISSASATTDLVFSASVLEVPRIDAGTDSPAGIASFSVSPSTLTCADIGANTVTLTSTDNLGGVASCTAVVTVSDNIAPDAICAPRLQFIESNSGAVNGAIPDNLSGTLSNTMTVTESEVIYDLNVDLNITHSWMGDVTVVLESPSGTMVTIVDRPGVPASTFGCAGDDMLATLDDEASLPVEDECGGGTPTINGSFVPNNALSAFDGENTAGTWTLHVTDNAGGDLGTLIEWDLNFSYSVPGNPQYYLDTNGDLTITAANIDGGSSDACGIASLAIDQTTFDCTDAGNTETITLTVTDNNGLVSTCTSDIDINDSIPPVALCQDISVFLDNAGNATITAGDIDNGSSDECGVTLSASTTAFTCADIGVHTVTLTVDDGNGNISTCTSQVTVADTTSPSITCLGNQTENFDAACQFTIPDYTGLVTTSDNCATPPTLTQTPGPGSVITGTTTITMTSDDGNGNTSVCSFDVLVVDNTDPVAVCQDITVYLDNAGNATITAADVDGGSSDQCGAVSLSASPLAFTCANIGANTVTLTVEDGNTNTASCSATATVLDTVSPVAVCQDITVYVDGAGNASITAADIDGGSSDNCGAVTLSADITAFTCADLGPNDVVLTVEDGSSNTSTCTAQVTVLDSIPPVISCPVVAAQCGDDVSGGVVTYPMPTATDNCGTTISQIDGTGLSSGSYFPTGTTTLIYMVQDPGGNTDTCSFDVEILPQPEAGFSFTPACVGEAIFFSDASIIDPLGTIVSWSWDMGDGSAVIGTVDPIHSYAAVGDYTVALTVESADGCVHTFTEVVTVSYVPIADFTATTECAGTATTFTNNWNIDPGYSGGATFAWDFGDGNSSTDENPMNTYSSGGTYTVTLTVTTDFGCEDMISFPVTVYDNPTALALASTECEGFATQFTDLSIGSGLSWDWDFGDTNSSSTQNPSHTYATAGTYTFNLTVTDVNGCSASTSDVVDVNELPTVAFNFANVCEESPADFTNASSAGTYAWDLGDGSSSILTHVAHAYDTAGFYDVQLTVTTAEGCVDSLTQQIEIYDNPEFNLNVTDVACYNIATGEIQVDVTVGSPAFTYTIHTNAGDLNQPTDTFIGLGAGSHSITVVDNNGCSSTDSTVVNQPMDTLGINLISTTNIFCHGESTGVIELAGTGGTPAYTYLIGGVPQSTGLFTGLPAGSHNIQILDMNLCPFDTSIVLTEPDTLVLLTDTIGHLLCNGDSSGFLGLTGTGGVLPYSYSLDGVDFQPTGMFNGLHAGGYTVTVMDSLGCTDTVNVTVTEPGILMLSLLGSTDALCNGQATGSIQVGATSGTPDYTYSIDGGMNWQGNADFPGVGAGTHSILVMDSNGCLDSVEATISEPPVLEMATTSSPVPCTGDSSGSISVTANGGTPGYTYSNDGGNNFQGSPDFIGLAAGQYVVTVMDANGCTSSESVVIDEPAAALSGTALVTDVLCMGDSTGAVTIQTEGGTGAYQYSIDNGGVWQNSNTFSNLPSGAYSVLVEDGNGCQATVGFSIGEPASLPEISGVLTNSPFCPGEANGSLTIQAFGGTPGYMYSVDGGLNFGADAIITGLPQGAYNVMVVDSNGCTVSDLVQLNDPDSIVISIDTVMAVNCEGDMTGQIVASASGGTGTLMFDLDGGTPQSDGTFSGLSDGTFSVTVSDVNGCTSSVMVEVPYLQSMPVADFSYIVAGETVSFSNQSVSGSTYHWNFGDGNSSNEENPIHMYSLAGNYDVTLTATNDCGSDSVTLVVSTVTFGVEDEAVLHNVSIFPNPSNGLITFKADLRDPVEKLDLQIMDLRGRVVWNTSRNNANGAIQMQMNLTNVAEGVYELQITGDAWRSNHRISITR